MTTVTQEHLTLYYSPTCPFCHRVLDALQDLGLTPNLSAGTAGGVTLKDRKDKAALSELINGGGKKTVPCLLIDTPESTQWMYESGDIVAFLKKHLG